MSRFTLRTIAQLLFAIGALMLAIANTDDQTRPAVAPAPAVVPVDGSDADTVADDNLELGPTAQGVYLQAVKEPEDLDVAGGLRGQDLTAAGVLQGPLAAQEWPGCKTAFHKSFSQRTSPIKAIGLHYTAGGNRPGWSDIDGLTAYSANRAREVSWHFAIDREGNCAYNVPLAYRAWTIGNLNDETANIEVVGTGRDPDYAGGGFAKLSKVVRRIARLHNIPLQLGAVDGNCNVIKPGIITHWQGGPCSGAHHDIKPYDINRVIARIRADALAASKERRAAEVACRKLNWHRHRAARDGHWSKRRGARARELKATIRRGRIDCKPT